MDYSGKRITGKTAPGKSETVALLSYWQKSVLTGRLYVCTPGKLGCPLIKKLKVFVSY